LVIALGIGFILSAIGSYMLSDVWVFWSRPQLHLRDQYARYHCIRIFRRTSTPEPANPTKPSKWIRKASDHFMNERPPGVGLPLAEDW
jgi:hypothetical protein